MIVRGTPPDAEHQDLRSNSPMPCRAVFVSSNHCGAIQFHLAIQVPSLRTLRRKLTSARRWRHARLRERLAGDDVELTAVGARR